MGRSRHPDSGSLQSKGCLNFSSNVRFSPRKQPIGASPRNDAMGQEHSWTATIIRRAVGRLRTCENGGLMILSASIGAANDVG
jgi:hypothetical protein